LVLTAAKFPPCDHFPKKEAHDDEFFVPAAPRVEGKLLPTRVVAQKWCKEQKRAYSSANLIRGRGFSTCFSTELLKTFAEILSGVRNRGHVWPVSCFGGALRFFRRKMERGGTVIQPGRDTIPSFRFEEPSQ